MSSDHPMDRALLASLESVDNPYQRIRDLQAQLAERDAQLKYQADLTSQHRDELEARIAALTAAGDAMAPFAGHEGTRCNYWKTGECTCRVLDAIEGWQQTKGEDQ